MRKSAKACLYGVVLAGVIGGTAAWTLTDKTVSLSVDGQARTVHTRSANVGGALQSAHIALAAHDVLAPGLTASIHDGSKIVLLRGRLLRLTVDGHERDVWTTATTVDQALAELGLGSGKTVSVSRSTRLPLSATDIELLTLKHVTVKADGKTYRLYTTAPTVAAVIAAAKLTVAAHDRVSAVLTAPVTEGEVITLHRVKLVGQTVTVQMPFSTKSSGDATQSVGTTQVVTAGSVGSKKLTYQLVYVDGKLAGKRLVTTVLVAAPVERVLKVGTKAIPVTPPAPASSPATATPPAAAVPAGTAQQIAQAMLTAKGLGASEFSCLVSLWNRESGWRTNAANASGAYGIPQALPGGKMASAGADWQTNPATQITWGLGYIYSRYGTPCGAWAHSQATNWY